METANVVQAGGRKVRASKAPGHWVLADLGKKVLRPGGRELTDKLLAALGIGARDHVVEFAPGIGATARLTLARKPASYTAVERDEAAAEAVRGWLGGPNRRCVSGSADQSDLADECADVVYVEAMLTMQSADKKARMVQEAYRLLREGGRFGIHELCIGPNELDGELRRALEQRMSRAIHHAVAPLTIAEWQGLLVAKGFTIKETAQAPMHLLEPRRLIADEGWLGAVRFGWNVLRDRERRQRVAEMRRVFREAGDVLSAVMIVAEKPGEAAG